MPGPPWRYLGQDDLQVRGLGRVSLGRQRIDLNGRKAGKLALGAASGAIFMVLVSFRVVDGGVLCVDGGAAAFS